MVFFELNIVTDNITSYDQNNERGTLTAAEPSYNAMTTFKIGHRKIYRKNFVISSCEWAT